MYTFVTAEGDPAIAIPEVEGQNGFVLTDILAPTTVGPLVLFQDAGDGPLEVFRTFPTSQRIISLTTGIPLVAGSTITGYLNGAAGFSFTLRGYVY